MTELVHVNILYMFTAFSITYTMGSGNMYIMLNMDEGIVRKILNSLHGPFYINYS